MSIYSEILSQAVNDPESQKILLDFLINHPTGRAAFISLIDVRLKELGMLL